MQYKTPDVTASAPFVVVDTPVEYSISDKVPFIEYAQIPRMNPSTLVYGLKSMRRLKRVIDNGGVTKTDAMILGGGVHCLLLEPDEFEARFAVMPDFHLEEGNVTGKGVKSESKGTTYYKQRAAAFIAANSDKEIIERAEYDKALYMIECIRAKPAATMWIDQCKKEVVVTGEICGVPMKGRLDLLDVSSATILDVKTTNSAAPFAFGRTFANLNYGMRMAIYRELVRQQIGRTCSVYMIAQEDRDDFDTVVYEVPDVVLDNAMPLVEATLTKYKSCLKSGEWPGVDGGEDYVQLVVPQWAMSDELDWGDT